MKLHDDDRRSRNPLWPRAHRRWCYGNLQALEAFDRLGQELGIPAGNVIHNGDIAAYCADPGPCIDLARERGWPAIKGNVEAQLAAGLGDCGCGFPARGACDGLSPSGSPRRSHARARGQAMDGGAVRSHDLHPGRAPLHRGARKPWRINRFMFASLGREEFARELDLAGSDAVIAGHTGIPSTLPVAAPVGQPRRPRPARQ